MAKKLFLLSFLVCVNLLCTESFGQMHPLPRISQVDEQATAKSQREIVNEQVNSLRTRMFITYTGDIVFQFPNFDVALDGSPEFAGEGDGTLAGQQFGTPLQSRRDSVRIIWRGNKGQLWDGSNFFLSPNYSHDLYAKHYYQQRIVSTNECWPTVSRQRGNHQPRFLPSTPIAAGGWTPSSSKSPETIERMFQATAQTVPFWLQPKSQTPLPMNRQKERNPKLDEHEDGMDVDVDRVIRDRSLAQAKRRQLTNRSNPHATSKTGDWISNQKSVKANYLESLRKAAANRQKNVGR